MDERKKRALEVVNKYSYYHAGSAVIVGAVGGQFGADTVVLTALTISMIEEICNIYDITNRKAKNIHIGRAVIRLTRNGTMVAKTILNWLPIGSLANGATTFFLTRNAGMKCISEIEQERMTVLGQIESGLVDFGKVVLIDTAYDYIDDATQFATQNIVDNTKELLGNDVTQDLGIDNLIAAIDKLPVDTANSINNIIGCSLKTCVKECINNQDRINTSELVKSTFIGALLGIVDEKVKLTEEEFQFRLLFDKDRCQAFDEFLSNTAASYDRLAIERGTWEAVKFLYSSISAECKVRFGMTSESIVKSVFNNPYDSSIDKTYNIYKQIISDSDNEKSVFAKGAMLYQTLCVINWQYNVPNTSFGRKDNKLLYFVAEKMIEYSQILSSKSVELIAFNLSQFVNKYNEFIEVNVSLPIIGLNNELRKNEAKKTLDIGNRYWLSIMENCNSLNGIYSDGVAFYIFRHQVDSIFSGRDLTLVKDDALVYAIAELMKHQLSFLKECDVNLVAYKIAEKLGALLSYIN